MSVPTAIPARDLHEIGTSGRAGNAPLNRFGGIARRGPSFCISWWCLSNSSRCEMGIRRRNSFLTAAWVELGEDGAVWSRSVAAAKIRMVRADGVWRGQNFSPARAATRLE